jgi:hypothetical protein
MTMTLDPTRESITPAALRGELLRQVRHETGLLADLARALTTQRAAVAHDRVAEVHASVDDLQSILHSLGDSRRRTTDLREAVGEEPASPELDAALRAHRTAAVSARREASINRDVLDRGIAAGERFLQEWFSTLDPASGYGPAEPRREPGGFIVDRRG